MENNLCIKFRKEEVEVNINIQQPDLANLIHEIVGKNLCVSKENISIDTENQEFDKEEFLEILISVHEEFSEEINKFYANIENDISTYYSDEELSNLIINKLKGNI